MTAPDSRTILAANLRRMIDDDAPPGARPSVRAWATARGLNVKMIEKCSRACADFSTRSQSTKYVP